MSEHILIAIAWPYASARIHTGNVTGSHLPGDICRRESPAQRDQQMHVVRHSTCRKEAAAVVAQDPSEVLKQTRLPVGVDQGLAVFGAEYDVTMERATGLRHQGPRASGAAGLSPLWGLAELALEYQGLTPLAIDARPVGAGLPVTRCT